MSDTITNGTLPDLAVPLSAVKWSDVFPENKLIGGTQFMEALLSGNNQRRTAIVIFHGGCDPLLSPVAWVQKTKNLNAASTLAYAFR